MGRIRLLPAGSSKAQTAHGPEKMGMKPTIPLREKSRQKPYNTGCQGGKGVLEDTFPGSKQFRTERAWAPTPGPLNLTNWTGRAGP